MRGSSFLNESQIACRMILGSKIDRSPLRREGCKSCGSCGCWGVCVCVCVVILEGLSLQHQEMFNNRTKRVSGEVGKRTYNQDHTDQQTHKKGPGGRKSAQSSRHDALGNQRTTDSQHSDDFGEATKQHSHTKC